MPNYALFFNTEDEIDYYPKLEDHSMTVEQIEEYLKKKNVVKWSMYDHLPHEEDIEVFTGFCYDSSDYDE